MSARLRAHRWHTAGWAMLALIVGAALGRTTRFELPVAPLPVPMYFLTVVGTAVLMTFPLMSGVPDFELALLREQKLRVVRAMVVLAGAATIVSVTWAVSEPALAVEIISMVPLIMILAAIAFAAVVIVGDLAWLAPATIGFLAIMVIAAVNSPLRRVLSQLPWPALLPLVFAGAALYVWRGPRLPA